MARSKSRKKSMGTMDAIAALLCSGLTIFAVVEIVQQWEQLTIAMKVVSILLTIGAMSYFIGLVPGVGALGNYSCIFGPSIALLLLYSPGGQGGKDKKHYF